jgi:fumarate hydratase, class II
VIKESVKTGRSIREIVLERKLMPEEDLDRALDVLALTKGGIT